MSFFLRRLGHGLLVLLAVVTLVFLAIHVIGNPVDLLVDPQADQADRARILHQLGLDQPWWRQYGHFLVGACQGDLGNSFLYGESALGLILERLPATLELAFAALLLALGLGLPLGLWAGLRPRSRLVPLIDALATLGFALPTFWVGILLILVFAVQGGWLPPGGRGATVTVAGIPLSILTLDGWRHLVLPAFSLGLARLALVIRLTRSGARHIAAQAYMNYARAKGLSGPTLLFRHLLPNLWPGLITVLGLELGSLIAFAVVTESVFGWPGMGKLLIDAIAALDRPVVVAYLLLAAALFVSLNLVADLLHGWLDPRVREGEGK